MILDAYHCRWLTSCLIGVMVQRNSCQVAY